MEKYYYVTHEEAQMLLPYLQFVSTEGPHKEVRDSARRLIRELGLVREDIDYTFSGKQIILTRKLDIELFEIIRKEAGI